MSRAEKAILIFLACIAAVLVVMVIGAALPLLQLALAWQAPLGPALALPTQTSTYTAPASAPTWTLTREPTSEQPKATPANTPEPSPTPTPIISCGGPPVMTILAIGSDQRSDSYLYGLADVIRIVRVDFIARRATILEFPRDLWVEIPDIAEEEGITHEKLNQAYLYGNKGYGDYAGAGEGPGLLALTLELNFGVRPDNYVAVNMQTFVRIVDAVGGINVNLPQNVDGRSEDSRRASLYFAAGDHHLDGQAALTLARVRPVGVFERAATQNLVLCALKEKLSSPSVLPRIPEIMASFQGAVQTDLSPEQISQLACLGTKMQSENIVFASFPEELFEGRRVYDPVFKKNVFIWDVDFNVLRDYAARFNAGVWPSALPIAGGEKEAAFCP